MKGSRELRKELSILEELPSPNFVVQRIISLVSAPETTVSQLHEAISMDPSLSAKILKLSNSAYYAVPKKVTKLSEAIMILGFKTVRNIALSIFTRESYFSRPIPGVDEKKLWEHMVLTAMTGEVVAEVLSFPNREEIFMAGLLHDLGKIVMGIISPRYLSEVVKYAKVAGKRFYDVERELEAPDHCELGQIVFEMWNMPDIVIETAAHHHDPFDVSEDALKDTVFMVHVANAVSNILLDGYGMNFDVPDLKPEVWKYLRLKPKIFEKILNRAQEKMSYVEEFWV